MPPYEGRLAVVDYEEAKEAEAKLPKRVRCEQATQAQARSSYNPYAKLQHHRDAYRESAQRQAAASVNRPAPAQQPVKGVPKIGRNDPCPCGSGKKYKNCHGKNMNMEYFVIINGVQS